MVSSHNHRVVSFLQAKFQLVISCKSNTCTHVPINLRDFLKGWKKSFLRDSFNPLNIFKVVWKKNGIFLGEQKLDILKRGGGGWRRYIEVF